jgi:putative sigma-54 modulation protein
MQVIFSGAQVDSSHALKEYTTEKLSRLARHFGRITSINITFNMEKLLNIVEATINIPNHTFHVSSESSVDMYSAVNVLIDKLDRKLKKHKEKDEGHR